MNFGLSQEQEMIVDTVRNFVEKEIYPHEAEVERTGNVPLELGQSIKQKVLDLVENAGLFVINLASFVPLIISILILLFSLIRSIIFLPLDELLKADVA